MVALKLRNAKKRTFWHFWMYLENKSILMKKEDMSSKKKLY